MAILHAPRDERLARFLRDARLVERHLVDPLAEQQQLPRVEPLAPRAVVAAQNGGTAAFNSAA